MRVLIAFLCGLLLCMRPYPALGAGDVPIVATKELPSIVRTIAPPAAATDFIKRAPAFSQVLWEHRSTVPLHYDEELAALLTQVNSEGNGSITWKRDTEVYGKYEYWDFPCEVDGKSYDDCDGYAIWKLRRLIELGLPSTPLIFALAYDETKTFHAVLIVVTDAGEFVLDNRHTTVKTVRELISLGYNFTARVASGERFNGTWVEFDPVYPIPPPVQLPIATANPNPPKPINPLCPR